MIPSVLRPPRLPFAPPSRATQGTALRDIGPPPAGSAQSLARSVLDTEASARLGVPLGMHADPSGALARYRQQLATARACGDVAGEASVLGRMGAAYTELGDLPDAVDAYEHAMTCIAYTADLEHLVAALYAGLGLACERLGDTDRALTCFTLDLSAASAGGPLSHAIVALGHLARVHRARGQHEASMHAVARGLALAAEHGDRALESELWWELGQTFAARGDSDTATRAMERRVHYAEAVRHPLAALLRAQWEALAAAPRDELPLAASGDTGDTPARADAPRNAHAVRRTEGGSSDPVRGRPAA
jgi:tetratricopeptide (TPR) repeat protein